MLSRKLDLQTWNRLTHQGQEKEKIQREKKEKTESGIVGHGKLLR